MKTPATFTIALTGPCSAATRSISESCDSIAETSASTEGPVSHGSMSSPTTSIPSCRSRAAIAAPMPFAAPVTTATGRP
jgi:hypothetical protein